MKYRGKISDEKDLVTKEYVDNARLPYVKSELPPVITNVLWIDSNNFINYYDSDSNEWLRTSEVISS